MIDPKKIEQIVHQIQESLLKNMRNLSNNIEKKIRQVLMNQFNKMDLIHRTEFNNQTDVILDIHKKLDQLDSRIKILENIYKNYLKDK